MRENEWTPKRKSLCNQFWDDCAQEECEEPCEVVVTRNPALQMRGMTLL